MSDLVEWVKAVASGVTPVAVVIAGSFVYKRLEGHKADLNKAVERYKTELGTIVQDKLETDRARRTDELERLRMDLADSLAKRARRTEYLRGQIENLYGPLSFLVESSARYLDTNRQIMNGYDEYFARVDPSSSRAEKSAEGVIVTANRYLDFVVENNKDTVKILRNAWGWLDPDDVEDSGQYLVDVARHAVEFEEAKKLPFVFYTHGALKNRLGPPSFMRPAFIERVRRKIGEKQAELAGLIGVTSVEQRDS